MSMKTIIKKKKNHFKTRFLYLTTGTAGNLTSFRSTFFQASYELHKIWIRIEMIYIKTVVNI